MPQDCNVTNMPTDIWTDAIPRALARLAQIPQCKKAEDIESLANLPSIDVSSRDTTNMLFNLSWSCRHFKSLFKDTILVRHLCQSVIDDDREIVRKILDNKPELLLAEPNNLYIESRHTWQRFIINESVLTIAVLRRQIEMIKLLLPYYDRIEDQSAAYAAKIKSLALWANYEIYKNDEEEEDIIIPKKYTNYAQLVVDAFIKTSFSENVLDENVELALHQLFQDLLPKKPVKLDDYFDIELLLLAMYAGINNVEFFLESRQCEVFCVRVVGLIQSLQSPEMAHIFCRGLYDSIHALSREDTLMGEYNSHYQLKSKGDFYRLSRTSVNGLGFSFFVGLSGCALNGNGTMLTACGFYYSKILRNKNSHFANLYRQATFKHSSTDCEADTTAICSAEQIAAYR